MPRQQQGNWWKRLRAAGGALLAAGGALMGPQGRWPMRIRPGR